MSGVKYDYPEVQLDDSYNAPIKMLKEVSHEEREAMAVASGYIQEIRTDTLRAQVRLTRDARNRTANMRAGQLLHAELRKVYHRLSEVLDFPEI